MTFMSANAPNHAFGPVHWAWQPYTRGAAAEPAVRRWLASRLNRPSADLRLVRDAHGRPRMALPHEGLDASWSHSGEGLLVAFGEGVVLGVDMEWRRPRPRALELAQRYFTADEVFWLTSQTPSQRENAFLRLWCAKEAVLKAHGRGIAFGLDRLAFADGDDGLMLVACDAALGVPGDWIVQEFEPAPGYLAALAWRRHP